MTVKLIYENDPDSKISINVGPRVTADIRNRVRELSGRFHPTAAELRELSKLKSMLKLLSGGGSDD